MIQDWLFEFHHYQWTSRKLYHISNSIWITYIVHIWFVRFISSITMGMKKSFNRMMAEVTECHIVAYATVTLDKIVLLYLFLLRRLKVSPFEITAISIIFILLYQLQLYISLYIFFISRAQRWICYKFLDKYIGQTSLGKSIPNSITNESKQ